MQSVEGRHVEWQQAEAVWQAAPNVIAGRAFGSARDGRNGDQTRCNR
jgi:hypothetical protein